MNVPGNTGDTITSPTIPATTVADLSELLSIEAEAARQEWEEALRLEAVGCRLDPIHWPGAATLLLGIVPMGLCDLGEALLSEGADTPPATRS